MKENNKGDYNMKNFVIGITGGVASGKSFLANRIYELNKENTCILEQDNYFKPHYDLTLEERKEINFDIPSEIDFDLFYYHLKLLSINKSIQSPVYSFQNYTREIDYKIIEPKSIIIVEGLSILYNPLIRSLIDLSIFIDEDDYKRINRRIKRDTIERGRTKEEIIERTLKHSNVMYHKYIYNTKNFADIIFKSSEQAIENISTFENLIKNINGGDNSEN